MHDAIHEQCRDGDFGHAVQELEYDRCEHNAAEQHRLRDRNHTPGSGMYLRRTILRLFDFGEGQRTRTYRRTYFIDGARNGKAHAFADDIRQWADGHELLAAHIRYSRPADDDQLGKSYDSEGHIDLALSKSLLPFDDYDFFSVAHNLSCRHCTMA